MKLSRRELLAGAAAGAVGAAGIYELVDRLVGSSPKRTAGAAPFPEQHLLEGVRTVHDDGIEVLVPPLHHAVLRAAASRAAGRCPSGWPSPRASPAPT